MEEQLKKLYDLMKVIIISQNKERIVDCLEIDRIIWEMINERHTKEDLLWCNEKWKSYEGGKIEDLSKKYVFPIYDLVPYNFGKHKLTIKLVGFYDWTSLMVWEKTIYKEYIILIDQLKIIRTFGLVIFRRDDGDDGDDDGIIARIDFPNLPDGLKKSKKMKSRWKADGKLEFSQLAKVIKVVITDDGKSIKEIIKP